MKCWITDERGSIGGIEGLTFGILIFAFGTILVINAWAVIDAKLAASVAAREAMRAYVEAPSDAAGRIAGAAAARSTMAGYDHLSTEVSFDPLGSGGYERCEPVQARVTARIPRISLPTLRGAGGFAVVSATHVEIIDPYRSGLTGVAACGL